GAVITSGTLDSQRRTIVLIRRLNPELYIIVRTRYIFDLDALYAAGASLVIAEEMEASVEIFSNVLRRHHVPRSVITTQAAVIRNEKYGPFLGEKLSEDRLAELQHFLTATANESALISADSPARDKTLLESGILTDTAVTVLAIVRGSEIIHRPEKDIRLAQGDVLLLIGTHADLDQSLQLLRAPTIS
ncbi:MAG: TrkA C-terminal domain-containing protein, partial [Leptospiraceae bacterium]|nr:TrkA C-terminal domain-containing protein [Leptospiraceae bacterium]